MHDNCNRAERGGAQPLGVPAMQLSMHWCTQLRTHNPALVPCHKQCRDGRGGHIRSTGTKPTEMVAVTSGAVSRMTLSACTMAEAKRRSGSRSRMLARAQKTFWGPSSRDSLRRMREPLRCSSRPPSGPRNLYDTATPEAPLLLFSLFCSCHGCSLLRQPLWKTMQRRECYQKA